MERSWRTGSLVTLAGTHTIADGIAVGAPVTRSLERVRSLVDDIVLVEDSQLLDAMRVAVSTLGIILEPSGAAGLAAIREHDLPGDRLATVLTGGNVHPDLLAKLFD
jgi:threonine dehydratase